MSENTLDAEAIHKQFQEFGCVKIPGALDPELLAHARRVYDATITTPKRQGAVMGTHNDVSGFRGEVDAFTELVTASPVWAQICQALWGSKNVWYYDHEVFVKSWPHPDYHEDGTPVASDAFNRAGKRLNGRGTPWHQDTNHIPFDGPHLANFWICFEEVPRANCLGVVKGSHKSKMSDEAASEIANNAGEDDLAQFDLSPGDIVILHPNCIHGGGPVGEDFSLRHTLCLRFFGDECFLQILSDPEMMKGRRYQGLKGGDPFHLCGGMVHLLGSGPPSSPGSTQNAARL